MLSASVCLVPSSILLGTEVAHKKCVVKRNFLISQSLINTS